MEHDGSVGEGQEHDAGCMTLPIDISSISSKHKRLFAKEYLGKSGRRTS